MQVDCGNNTDTNHQCSANASAGLESNALKHLREPERTDEAPNLAYEGDEDTNTGSFFLVTIDSVGDKHGGDDLVANGSDGGANQRCNVPLGDVFSLNEEDNVADDTEEETSITKPETVLRLRTVTSRHLTSSALHPRVGQDTSKLFTDDGTDDDTGELVSNLLSVELKLLLEQLGNLDGDEDRGKKEDHRIGGGRDHDCRMATHSQRLNEVPSSERSRVNTSEAPVLLLEIRATVLNTLAQVPGLGSEEDVENKLSTVDHGQNIVDPAVANVVCDEAHGEATQRDTQSNHQGPDTHVLSTFSLEEGLADDTATDGSSRTDEESDQGSACSHASIAMTVGTTNVADKTADCRDQPDWTTSISDREGTPE